MVDVDIDHSTTVFIYVAGVVGLLFALHLFRLISKINLYETAKDGLLQSEDTSLLEKNDSRGKLLKIYEAIKEGADSFLFAEYRICAQFIVVFGVLVAVMTSRTRVNCGESAESDCVSESKWVFKDGLYTSLAFVIGAVTSIMSGYLGMKVAVFSNARTTVSAASPIDPWMSSFNTAFRAGGVMGFSLCGLAMIVLYSLILVYYKAFGYGHKLFECVAGFGLGGSTIALFGRVGGGIYTKAADVGADLAGKVVSGIPEDDPRNPATIADNVGDNVGDVAGMGSDLFGSFAEATCAALVIVASFPMNNGHALDDEDDSNIWRMTLYPLVLSGLGLFVCLICSFIATNISPVQSESDIEKVLKVQLASTTLLMTIVVYPLTVWALPEGDFQVTDSISGNAFKVFICVMCGLWSGNLIGFITEYYTSHSYRPTREVAESCETGAATNIIYGLALGYKSVVIPVLLISGTVYITFNLLDLYGVALSALGMLSTLATCLSIDVYGPVCDNAGGIAEMSGLPSTVRDKTDALDAAGNTTAAIGKGFAIGSACLVGLALFGAFIARSGLDVEDIPILSPTVFTFLLIGAMVPYYFSAMTMKSVAAKQMVNEVARQFREIPGLLEGKPGHGEPDHAACIKISTEASLKEMVPPGLLVITLPLISGTLFGSKAVCGLLAGAISGSVQMALSSSNSGGCWDNAKKYIEKGSLSVKGVVQKQGSDVHKAAVVGDTVGDPLKDTSGPALNIVMKLMAILSLVFADFFKSINDGNGVIHWGR